MKTLRHGKEKLDKRTELKEQKRLKFWFWQPKQ